MKGSSIKPGDDAAGRRAFMVGVTAACAVATTRAFGQTATPAPYRTAGELLADLTARRVSSVELLDQTIARIDPSTRRPMCGVTTRPPLATAL